MVMGNIHLITKGLALFCFVFLINCLAWPKPLDSRHSLKTCIKSVRKMKQDS